MRNRIKSLIWANVQLHARVAQSYGLTYNSKDKFYAFKKFKEFVIANNLTENDLLEEIKAYEKEIKDL